MPEPRAPAEILAIATLPQSAPVMTELTVRVRVLDELGAPFAGASIRFRVTGGDGRVEGESLLYGAPVATNDQGVASVAWTMGSKAITNSLTAEVPGLAPITFAVAAVAGPFARIEPAQGDWQVAPPGSTLPLPLRAQTVDVYGNPVSGVVVGFSVVTGNGTLDAATATSDASGYADAGRWTLGPSEGTQKMLARAGAVTAEFSAQAHMCSAGDSSFWCGAATRLLFVRRSDGQIYRTRLDGTELTKLTSFGEHRVPVTSPDGRRIAFGLKLPGGKTDVYVMNADGSNAVRLTGGQDFYGISWAPDSRRLAISDNGLYASSMYVIDADAPLAEPTLIATMARAPAWSPDGSRIAFVEPSGDDGYDALAIMKPDGGERTLLSGRDGSRFGLSWLRDGRLVAGHCAGTCTLSTMYADGLMVRNLDVPSGLWNVASSTDGLWLAFSTLSSVSLLSTDGTQMRTLTSDGFEASWTP